MAVKRSVWFRKGRQGEASAVYMAVVVPQNVILPKAVPGKSKRPEHGLGYIGSIVAQTGGRSTLSAASHGYGGGDNGWSNAALHSHAVHKGRLVTVAAHL